MANNLSQPPFQVNFIEPREVRMGSPYNLCSIKVSGSNKLHLEENAWQDKLAWSKDFKYLVLIKWNFEKNEPSFHFVIYNVETGENKISERIFGLLNDIEIVENKILYNKFFLKERFQNEDIETNFDEEFEFNYF
jgi:hypothetical protein